MYTVTHLRNPANWSSVPLSIAFSFSMYKVSYSKTYHENYETDATHKSWHFLANRDERLLHFSDGIQASF